MDARESFSCALHRYNRFVIDREEAAGNQPDPQESLRWHAAAAAPNSPKRDR
jgi:hypothetical protein